MRQLSHLVRRTFQSLSARPVSDAERALVVDLLSAKELHLWSQFSVADQRHSLLVLERFDLAAPDAPRDARAGVLLHDIGKIRSSLGTFGRVIATCIGPRTSRFAAYVDHERIGHDLLREIESSSITIETALGHGTWGSALRAADEL